MFTEKTMDTVAAGLVGLPIDVDAFERAFLAVPGVESVRVIPGDGDVTVVYRRSKPETTLARIIAAANAGMPPREIAVMVGWKPESVSSILSRARADGQVIRRHPPGRPKTSVGRRRGNRASAAMRATIAGWKAEFDDEMDDVRRG